MKYILLQTPQTVKVIEPTEPMDFNDLYHVITNWLLLNGPRVLIAVVVFFIGQWLIKFCRKWLQNIPFIRNVHSSVKPFVEGVIVLIAQVLLFIFVMQIIGVELTLFAAAIASFGVALGLALSGTLQNFACGLLILFLKPFKVGDRIIAQGQEGIVESIQIFYTIVKNDDRTVIVPNSKLSNEVIIKLGSAS